MKDSKRCSINSALNCRTAERSLGWDRRCPGRRSRTIWWSTSASFTDPDALGALLKDCTTRKVECRLYAVNDTVVWTPDAPSPIPTAARATGPASKAPAP